MSPEQPNLPQLLDRIRGGSQDAVRQLLDRYGPHILTVIRQKLDVSMRSVFDSLDFLQDVWASFFAGEFDEDFRDPNALIAFLVKVARNKVSDVARKRLQSGKYNFSREQSLDGSARLEGLGLTAAAPMPNEVAVAREEWDRLLAGRPVHQRRMLELLRDGYTHEEIAAELKLNEKTVRRVLQKILARWKP
jgi:RNA polymerase sigma-70 factor (ECF subfamily)